MTPSIGSPAQLQFQSLLRDLFQFDSAELDFGVYRIMNHKRKVLDDFIVNRLPEEIKNTLNQGPLVKQTQANSRLDEATKEIQRNLGNIIDSQGNLKPDFLDTPLGRKYLEAKADAESGRSYDLTEAEVYNHLYTFFRRYYQGGDFISQRRHSAAGDTYAIPYDGQEVVLYWANQDQYYVKTSEYFLNYEWTANNGVKVKFRVDNANLEQNNAKGEHRFFLPRTENIEWDDDERTLTVPIEYRPLTNNEKANYGNSHQQDKINSSTVATITQKLSHNEEAQAIIAIPIGTKDTPLATHLRRYTTRNNTDFFIHKNLNGFLNRELNFYLKSEVLKLDTLLATDPETDTIATPAAAALQQARLIKTIGGKIIAFLGQLEDFQKSLWEKQKFVTKTAYCITIGCITPCFYQEVADNAAQWQEWRKLGFVEESVSPTLAFLRDNPTLPLDTRHFSQDFTDSLLASFDNLEAKTDGILIHGDNWQALHLLEATYQKQVKAIYIDPPYNTKMAPILYKNNYKHSTWMSLISQSIQVATCYMAGNSVLCIAIDDEEVYNLKSLVDAVLGAERYAGTVVVQANPGGRDINTHLAISHDYCLVYAQPEQKELLLPKNNAPVTHNEGPFRRTGGLSSPNERENSEFAFYYDPNTLAIVGVGGRRISSYPEPYQPSAIHFWDVESASIGTSEPTEFFEQHPGLQTIIPQFTNGERGVWRWSDRNKIVNAINEGNIFLKTSRNKVTVTLRTPARQTYKPKTVWHDARYSATTHGTILLQDMFGRKGEFSYPKSIHTVKDTVEAATYGLTDAWVLDYFAGSGTTGHAVIKLNREDTDPERDADTRRRFILVEQGEYFDTVLLPRIKKTIYAPEWDDGKPKRQATPDEVERSPRIIKYLHLESYEDTLDSVEFDDQTGELALESLGEEHLLKYMLSWETKNSYTRLKAEDLSKPFSYQIRGRQHGQIVNLPADLPETFNWLIGLRVKTRRVLHNQDHHYLVYQGETRAEPGKQVTVIWRDTTNWNEADYAADRQFIIDNHLQENASAIYLNGGATINLNCVRAIEPLFNDRMFSEVAKQ